MRITEITDDLTGAADSGSYFTARGCRMKICISGHVDLSHEPDELLAINLSSRNTKKDVAQTVHYELMKRLPGEEDRIFMKKIGTGFRGNDAMELNGLLEADEDFLVFLIDHAPDLGTFTLYGNQYCEGEILPKSLYAKDPVMPPTEAFIPDILGHDSRFPIGLVTIDAVKGGTILEAVSREIAAGKRIIVFDAVTREDTGRILAELQPVYPKVFWTGSLGIADGLAEYLYGPWQKSRFPVRSLKCFGFCASAYDISKKQLAYSATNGLKVVEFNMDQLLDGDRSVLEKTIRNALTMNREHDVMVVPKVERYSYQPGTSTKILEVIRKLSGMLLTQAVFDRLIVIGGETSQNVFGAAGIEHLSLGRPIAPGVAQGKILDGILTGKEFALKGGSMGRENTLDQMMCKCEVEY